MIDRRVASRNISYASSDAADRPLTVDDSAAVTAYVCGTNCMTDRRCLTRQNATWKTLCAVSRE